MTVTLSRAQISQVNRAVEVLLDGGIVAYPTDTVYGLAADIKNDEAVRKVFAAKKRPADLPLPLLIDDRSQLADLISGRNDYSDLLMDRFWPGALTIIFNKAPGFQSPALAGGSKIGLRIPDHPVTRLLIHTLSRPIVGTSANVHGAAVTLTPREVRNQLGSSVDFIIEGACGGTESTIVDVTVDPPGIVREGAIPGGDILSLLPKQGGHHHAARSRQ